MVTTFSSAIFGVRRPRNQTITINPLSADSLIRSWQIDGLSNAERSAAVYLLNFRYQGP
jgi:hypothetical protein